jgi:glucose/arabinose dehydrogenase
MLCIHKQLLIVFCTLVLCAVGIVACNQPEAPGTQRRVTKTNVKAGELFLPDNFESLVVTDSLGPTRHLAVNNNGDIYVKLLRLSAENTKGSIALRDTNSDGRADLIENFGNYKDKGAYGTSMRIHKGYLYFSTAGDVFRVKLNPGKLVPEGKSELLLADDYWNSKPRYSHIAKPLAFDDEGNMYVPFGSPTDICQVNDREPGSPGQNPCPQLAEHAGIWKFSESKPNQTQKDGTRYATGLRSVVAMDWNKQEKALYVVLHGRDDLARTWPALYNEWQSAVLPSEEFFEITKGANGGWPYYYYDHIQGKQLLNAEYGGDGKKEGNAKGLTKPLMGFPGHFAPNDLFFYTGNQFPDRYKNGAFIAFHGSTIRAPYPQAGYFIGFVPFKNGKPSGPWEVFADGFAGVDTIVNTSDARHRPMGIAMGPDGSLYFSDSEKGRIWRVMFKGDKKEFGPAQLAGMQKRKETQAHIKTPDIIKDNLTAGKMDSGQLLYSTYCASCHQKNGKGDGTRFPPLDNSEWVKGDKNRLIGILLTGLSGRITVKGRGFNEAMPANSFLKDKEAALILTYIRRNFGNNSSAISPAEVSKIRAAEQRIKNK